MNKELAEELVENAVNCIDRGECKVCRYEFGGYPECQLDIITDLLHVINHLLGEE